MKVCPVCWTSSFQPTEHEKDCELKHPHEGEHESCLCCAQSDWIYKMGSQIEILMAGAEDWEKDMVENINNMTNEEFAEYWKRSKKEQKYGQVS